MVKSLTGELSSIEYGTEGSPYGQRNLSENGKLNRFIVARIYSRKHLTNMRTAGKKSKRNKRWEEVVTYQQ
jgi:hypothetical protein